LALERWCCLVLLCAAIGASAQSVPSDGTAGPKLIPRTKAERETRYAVHHRILLTVQVLDATGHVATGLDAKDFTLKINQEAQTIASFKSVADGAATAHAFLVIDKLNNSARDLAYIRKAIEKLGAGNSGAGNAGAGKAGAGNAGVARPLPLPTSLVVLTETGAEVRSASRNAQAIADDLAGVTKNFHLRDCTEEWNNAGLGKNAAILSPDDDKVFSRPATAVRISDCLGDKYRLSLTALLEFAHRQENVPGRAILIWIGPGWPISTGKEFDMETPHVRETYFSTLVDASTRLREGQVTLDAVSWPSSLPIAKLNASDWPTLMRGTRNAEQASAGSIAMPVLAHMSGGQVYLRGNNLTQELAACLADGESYYVLGFDSVPSTAPAEFRAIEVTVDKPGYSVRTNTEYYEQP
jgi:VWFA-related protein